MNWPITQQWHTLHVFFHFSWWGWSSKNQFKWDCEWGINWEEVSVPDLRKGHMKPLTLHHGGLSLFLPSPLTSTVILKYSSLPVPLQLQSHPSDIAFPLPASHRPGAFPTSAGILCQRHPLLPPLLLSFLLIFILDRSSVPAVCSCSHTQTHTSALKRKLKHTPAERNPVGAWVTLAPWNIRPSFWCSLLSLRTRHILTYNHLHPQCHYTHCVQ